MSHPKRVVCVDDTYGAAPFIVKGKEYTVLREVPVLFGSKQNYSMLDLPGLASGPWNISRFEDVVAETTFTPFKVECVDNDNEISYLHVGSIYTVLHQSDRYYYLEGIAIKNSDGFWNGGMKKERFIVVHGVAVNPTVAVNDHTCPSCKNDRCSKSEKTCWKCGGVL